MVIFLGPTLANSHFLIILILKCYWIFGEELVVMLESDVVLWCVRSYIPTSPPLAPIFSRFKTILYVATNFEFTTTYNNLLINNKTQPWRWWWVLYGLCTMLVLAYVRRGFGTSARGHFVMLFVLWLHKMANYIVHTTTNIGVFLI